MILWLHFVEALLCKGRHAELDHHDCPLDVFSPHSFCQRFDRLHAHLDLFGKEHKQLVLGIVGLHHKNSEVLSSRDLTVLGLEFLFAVC